MKKLTTLMMILILVSVSVVGQFTYDQSTDTYRDTGGNTYIKTADGKYTTEMVGIVRDYYPTSGVTVDSSAGQTTAYRYEKGQRIQVPADQTQAVIAQAEKDAAAPVASQPPSSEPTTEEGEKPAPTILASPTTIGPTPSTGAQPSVAPVYYVNNGPPTTINGVEIKTGQIYTLPPDQEKPEGSIRIPQSTANYAGNNAYTYDPKSNTFIYTSPPKKDKGALVDYETTVTRTSTVVTTDSFGNPLANPREITRIDESVRSCRSDCDDLTNWKFDPATSNMVEIERGVVGQAPPKTEGELPADVYANTRISVITRNEAGRATARQDTYYTPVPGMISKGVVRVSDVHVYETDATGKPIYPYKYYIDSEGNEGPPGVDIDDLPPDLQRAAIEAKVKWADGSGAGFWDSANVMTWGQLMGRFMRAYNEYQGVMQLSNLIWPKHAEDVQRRKAQIQQNFCLAAGITQCTISTICGSVSPVDADNIVVGRGPSGQYVSSASINAERSLPIKLSGLTKQQLIDMFGNSTAISGVLYNFNDPQFNPSTLGEITVRLYHVQYSVTNNAADQRGMFYNLELQSLSTGYSPKWYSVEPMIDYQATEVGDKWKFSATTYDKACLRFNPGMPTGHAGGRIFAPEKTTHHICDDFEEYAGGPTTIQGAQTSSGLKSVAPTSQAGGAI